MYDKTIKTHPFWLDCSDKRLTLLYFKYIQFFLQIIKRTSYLLRLFVLIQIDILAILLLVIPDYRP